MVLGHFKNKTYYKNLEGYTACIEQHFDGSALLFINSPTGEEVFRRFYCKRNSALKAWYTYGIDCRKNKNKAN